MKRDDKLRLLGIAVFLHLANFVFSPDKTFLSMTNSFQPACKGNVFVLIMLTQVRKLIF